MRKLYLKFVDIKIVILISVTLVELTNKIKKRFLSRYKHDFNKYMFDNGIVFTEEEHSNSKKYYHPVNHCLLLILINCYFFHI